MEKIMLSCVSLSLLTFSLSAHAGGIKCSDFSSHAEAQAYYDAKKPGYQRLDRDKDGIACEALR